MGLAQIVTFESAPFLRFRTKLHIIDYRYNSKISSTRSVVYHHCESEYSLRLMIYTFGDEIHANA